MSAIALTAPQKRWLAIATAAALAAGSLFVSPYFSLIIVSAITAYLFNPVYQWLTVKLRRPGLSSMLTLIISILTIVIPLCVVVLLTIAQVEKLLATVDSSATTATINEAFPKLLESVNQLFASWGIAFRLTSGQMLAAAQQLIETLAKQTLDLLTSSISSIVGFFTIFILYCFVFTNLLRHQNRLFATLSKLNLLGDDLGRLYAQKIAAMTTATIRGQFIIALAQGFASSLGLYVAGVRGLFFFGFMLCTVLSAVPLGAGILTIPIGIIMALLGNIWGGVFLVAWHLIVVTNIDNILRPQLVPRQAQLNSALMLLAVFAGLAHFGFLGIVLGPILMIIIVTTVQVFVSANHQPDTP